MANPGTSTQQQKPLHPFTCLACNVYFQSADLQREHHRTDWHRYNLKRKMTDLPPVTAENFAIRLAAAQSSTAKEAERSAFKATCDACRKTYSTENAYQNHMTSKKHKEMVEKYQQQQQQKDQQDSAKANEVDQQRLETLKEDSQRARDFQRRLQEAQSETEVLKVLEERMQHAIRLNPDHDCLFCPHQSQNMDENLEHMTKTHSFFIPDIEFLVDMRGLIAFLGEKISVHLTCLYCNGRGRGFHSLEAVRTHMLGKGHAKIAYEDGADVEIADFYDFSSTWAGQEGVEEDADGQLILQNSETFDNPIETEDMELLLPSGQRLGHRALHRYYKQRPKPSSDSTDTTNQRDSVLIQRLHRQYRALGWYGTETEEMQKRADRAEIRRRRIEKDRDMRVGVMGNRLQRHFRAQIDF